EQPWLDLVDGEAGDRARKTSRESRAFARACVLGEYEPIGKLERRLKGIGQTDLDLRPDDEAVDDHLDVVLHLLVEGRDRVDLVELAVDLHALEAALLELLQLLAVLALAAAHHRRKQVKPCTFRHLQDAVDHLRYG